MNKSILLTLLISVSFLGCKKQETISDIQSERFVKLFGSFSKDDATQMAQTDDEGFIIVGTVSTLTRGKDAAIIKTDKYGNEEWSRAIGDTLDDFASSVLVINDGYLVLGTKTDTLMSTNMWLIKLNTLGQVQWNKKYNTNNYDEGVSLINSNDNGYILVGNTIYPTNNDQDIYCLKTDNSGNIIWDQHYGSIKNDYCKQIVPAIDGYRIIGSTESYGEGGYDIFFQNINENGVGNGNEQYGGTSNDFGQSIIASDNSNFLVLGTNSSIDPFGQIYCLEVSSKGISTLWEKNYGGAANETANHISAISNGNYLIVGSTESYGKGEKDQYLVCISSVGDTIWTNTFGYSDNDIANYAIETFDGGFAILGTTTIENNQMVSLIKTDSKGRLHIE